MSDERAKPREELKGERIESFEDWRCIKSFASSHVGFQIILN
jgi:hypothetical protein